MHTKLFQGAVSITTGMLLAAGVGIVAGTTTAVGTPTAAHASSAPDSIVVAATGQSIAGIATRELNDNTRNYEIGNNCSFYGGNVFGWPACGGMPGWGGGGDWYAWCAAFAKYVWREAGGIPYLSEIDGFAVSFRTYGQNHGTWHARGSGYAPRPGDAIVFDWEQDGVIDHVGIVQSVSGSNLYTVEGNSSNSVKRNTYTNFAGTSAIVGFTTAVGLTSNQTPRDFNGDGRTDQVLYQPMSGHWIVRNILEDTWGHGGSYLPVVADFNNDAQVDLGLFQPSTGQWWVRNVGLIDTWGSPGDTPLVGDYNGDGRTDLAVFLSSTGQWWVRNVGLIDTWGDGSYLAQ